VGVTYTSPEQLAKLYERQDRMAKMLRRLEWTYWVPAGPDPKNPDNDLMESACPICHDEERHGHDPGCDLAVLLRELP